MGSLKRSRNRMEGLLSGDSSAASGIRIPLYPSPDRRRVKGGRSIGLRGRRAATRALIGELQRRRSGQGAAPLSANPANRREGAAVLMSKDLKSSSQAGHGADLRKDGIADVEG